MIKINNKIGNNINCEILHKGKPIGKCDNILSFYDILCQVKKEKSNDYQILVKTKIKNGYEKEYIFKINSEGKLSPSSYPNVKLWTDMLDKQLLYLSGYTNNVIYEQ